MSIQKATITPLEFDETAAIAQAPEGRCMIDLRLVKDVVVDLEVYLGSATLTVEALLALEKGIALTLDAALDEPVALRLNGKTVARGQLVAIGDHFGIQLTELVEKR